MGDFLGGDSLDFQNQVAPHPALQIGKDHPLGVFEVQAGVELIFQIPRGRIDQTDPLLRDAFLKADGKVQVTPVHHHGQSRFFRLGQVGGLIRTIGRSKGEGGTHRQQPPKETYEAPFHGAGQASKGFPISRDPSAP